MALVVLFGVAVAVAIGGGGGGGLVVLLVLKGVAAVVVVAVCSSGRPQSTLSHTPPPVLGAIHPNYKYSILSPKRGCSPERVKKRHAERNRLSSARKNKKIGFRNTAQNSGTNSKSYQVDRQWRYE